MNRRRVAVMQPYFFPYIGYFQLMDAADVFVLYDNLKYTKKGWINRNRFLEQGMDRRFSIPIASASDSLHINERRIADSFDTAKLLRRIRAAYLRAPHFDAAFDLFQQAVTCTERCLYAFLENSIRLLAEQLVPPVKLIRSSTIDIDHGLAGQSKVLAICKALEATEYVNAIGGRELYDPDVFDRRGVPIRFIQSSMLEYVQFNVPFIPWLSILDVMMFNSMERTREMISGGYELIEGERSRDAIASGSVSAAFPTATSSSTDALS
ncbi:MAG: WbqC family protein [Planctomycetota bacterium]